MSQPWMKFYPRDWRGDQALRAVSIAARGLWMECLCVMHEASPYGHLVLNGAPVEAAILARMTGTTEEEVKALLAELSQSGVSSVTRAGVVFSRRMVSDFARANKGRKAVERRYAQQPELQQENDGPNRVPTGPPTTQSPDSQKPEDSSLRSESPGHAGSDPPGFAEFYSAFPLKKARRKAAMAYAAALKRAPAPTLLQGALRYAQERAHEDQNFTKHPATWLNQDCWLDEPVSRGTTGGRNGGHQKPAHKSFAGELLQSIQEDHGGQRSFAEGGGEIIDVTPSGSSARDRDKAA